MPAYTVEIGTAEQGFRPPYAVIDQEQWPDTRDAFLYAARIAREPYRLVYGPDVASLDITIDPAGKMTFEILFAAEGNGAKLASGAEYSLDHPFWSPQADPHLIQPAQEPGQQPVFVAVRDTTGLVPGRHTLFVRGLNLAGIPGPTSSAFFLIPDPADPHSQLFYIPFITNQ